MLTWARLCNGGINVFGWAVSSLGLFLVLLQAMNVFNRYFFAQNQYFDLFTTFYDEVLLVGFSALFMLGSAFAFNRDAHVRVDIVYAGLNPRRQSGVNLIGTLIFMVPMAVVIMYYSFANLETAWKLAESGPNGDDGVTFFWLWKSMVPAFCVLTLIGGMNYMIENFARLTESVQLTNLIFGAIFVVLGVWGAVLMFDIVAATSLAEGSETTLEAWVNYAVERKPEPAYRLTLWTMMIWAGRLFFVAMAIAGAWAAIRAALGLIDPVEAEEMLKALDEPVEGQMGEA